MAHEFTKLGSLQRLSNIADCLLQQINCLKTLLEQSLFISLYHLTQHADYVANKVSTSMADDHSSEGQNEGVMMPEKSLFFWKKNL